MPAGEATRDAAASPAERPDARALPRRSSRGSTSRARFAEQRGPRDAVVTAVALVIELARRLRASRKLRVPPGRDRSFRAPAGGARDPGAGRRCCRSSSMLKRARARQHLLRPSLVPGPRERLRHLPRSPVRARHPAERARRRARRRRRRAARLLRRCVVPAAAGPILVTLARLHVHGHLERLHVAAHRADRRPTSTRCPSRSRRSLGEHVQDVELMMAGAVLTVLPVVLLFVCLQRYYIAGVMAGGVKSSAAAPHARVRRARSRSSPSSPCLPLPRGRPAPSRRLVDGFEDLSRLDAHAASRAHRVWTVQGRRPAGMGMRIGFDLDSGRRLRASCARRSRCSLPAELRLHVPAASGEGRPNNLEFKLVRSRPAKNVLVAPDARLHASRRTGSG